VPHLFDTANGRVTNLRVATGRSRFSPDFKSGNGAGMLAVPEADQGADLNGDGDTDDFVVHATRLTDRNRNGRFDFAEAAAARTP
jgi:hypothetical protein